VLFRSTGLTAIVAPNGNIIQQLPAFEVAVLSDNIIPMAGLTPYAKIGDALIMYVIVLLLLGMLLHSRFKLR